MPVNRAPAPLPRTAAGLHAALIELLPNRAAEDQLRVDADALVQWIRQREVGGASMFTTVRRPSSKPSPKAAPQLFPRGTSRLFEEFERVVQRLPELIDALVAVGSPLAAEHRDIVAAPLYSAVWMDGKPEYWYPSIPRWLGPNNADAEPPDVVLTDVETAKVVPYADKAAYFARGAEPVLWWPAVPASLAEYGTTLQTCPTASLVTGGFLALPGYAATMAQLDDRVEGYMRLFFSLKTSTAPNKTKLRASIKKTAMTLRQYTHLFEPVGPLLVADLAQYLDTVTAAIAALAPLQIPGDNPMPLSSATPASISTLAASIRDSITTGHGGRIAVAEGGETAFSWSPGIAATLLNYLTLGTAVGRRTTVVIASDSGAANGGVAELGTKPNAVNFASTEVDLMKYAGIATLSMESTQFVGNIETAISVTMTSRLVRGIEADVVTAILANAGVSIPGAADMTDGVLSAIAAIRNNGGTATVVGLSSGDWLAIMKATGNGSYLNFSNPEAGPAGTWLGLSPVIIPSLVDGTAIVLDGSAVTVLEAAGGPLAIVDCVTMLVTNQVRVALECFAVGVVNSPGGVAKVVTALSSTAEVTNSSGKRVTASA